MAQPVREELRKILAATLGGWLRRKIKAVRIQRRKKKENEGNKATLIASLPRKFCIATPRTALPLFLGGCADVCWKLSTECSSRALSSRARHISGGGGVGPSYRFRACVNKLRYPVLFLGVRVPGEARERYPSLFPPHQEKLRGRKARHFSLVGRYREGLFFLSASHRLAFARDGELPLPPFAVRNETQIRPTISVIWSIASHPPSAPFSILLGWFPSFLRVPSLSLSFVFFFPGSCGGSCFATVPSRASVPLSGVPRPRLCHRD